MDNKITLKHLQLGDAKLLFSWRNNPEIYRLGSSNRPLKWEEHFEWIKQSLNNPTRKVYIILINNEPAGQLRFDLCDNFSQALISIYLTAEFRNKGIGLFIISMASSQLFNEVSELLKVIAFIRSDNQNSISAFIKAGFTICPGINKFENHISMVLYRKQNADILNYNLEFYENLVEKYGDDFRALNWGSKESQYKRFSILTQTAIFNAEQYNILDIGCGTGDFYEFLKQNFSNFTYTGVDLSQGMINTARKRFPGIQFENIDFLQTPIGPFDYIFTSGIFAYVDFTFMKTLITAAFDYANVCFAFNSLSSLSAVKESNENYANPSDVFAFCQTLSPWVTLRHDYHPNDFTVCIYKNQQI